MSGFDAVVGHHMNPYRSGVARFNAILAREMGVDAIHLLDPRLGDAERPLLSFKFGELRNEELARGEEMLSELRSFGVFLHSLDETPLEQALLQRAEVVFAGNHEISTRLGRETVQVWAPALIQDHRRFEPAHITVFSFGMAHKLQVDRFGHLRQLLDGADSSYRVYVSYAKHETAADGEEEEVFAQMRALFEPSKLYFLGNLSDVAVYNHLVEATFFASFFPGGVRANNTSIATAMEHGAVVITNLDEYSPPEYQHLVNVIDIDQLDELPSDPLALRRISLSAMETAREKSWQRLVSLIG